MKTVFKIVFCIISVFITLDTFGQQLNDQQIGLDVARITKRLQELGIDEKGIQQEILLSREMYQKVYVEQQKTQNEILEKIKAENNTSTLSNRAAVTDIPASEKAVLQALYNGNGGINWTNRTNWNFNNPVISSELPGGWYGVTVVGGFVVGLQIGSNNLIGSFPNLSGLTKLQVLVLDNNFTPGPIPLWIYNSVNLKYLWLHRSNLNGSISANIGNLVKLESLILASNNLEGALPSEIGLLVNLRVLNLQHNKLTGTIPSQISQINGLEQIMLSYNNLIGVIPQSFSSLTRLQGLWFHNNNLEGPVPNLTGNLQLSLLNFSSNKFRFLDFINEFQTYKNRILITSHFQYSPQAKTDVARTENKTSGQPVSMTMCEDNRFHAGDTFQWFKNGVAVPGATNRIYTIPSLVTNDAGTYTCKSSHASNPDMSPLVLEREPITLNVTAAPSLSSCPETFEGTKFPPAGWLVANNGIGLVNEWVANTTAGSAYTGTKAAFVDRENIGINRTSQDWLVTPRFTVPANGELRFFTKQFSLGNQGTVYQVRVTTSTVTQGNITASFPTVTQAYTETTLNTTYNVYEEKIINLSAFAGQQINVAFVKIYTQPTETIGGDRWFIDNVKVVQACGLPSALTISPITVTSANVGSTTLSWQANGATQWEVFFGLVSSSQSLPGTVVNTNSFSVFGIIPGQLYYYRVKSVCTSCGDGYKGDWVSSNAFSVPNYCAEDVPTNLVFSNNTGTSCTVAWSPVANAVSYEVAIVPTTPGLFDPTGYPITAVTALNYTFSSLLSNLAYTIFVRSVCLKGQKSVWVRKTTEKPVLCNFIGKPLFERLLNFLKTQTTLPNGYTCPELTEFAPFITDANPTINNFSNVNGLVKFNFSNHGVSYGVNDVEFSYTVGSTADISLIFTDFYSYDNFPTQFTTDDNEIKNRSKFSLRHINYCVPHCTPTNPGTAIVKQLFVNLVNHLKTLVTVPNGYTCPQLSALAPYITDANPAIYNYIFDNYGLCFSFSAHPLTFNPFGTRLGIARNQDVFIETINSTAYTNFGNVTDFDLSSFVSPNVYIDRVGISFANTASKIYIRHINFCPTITISCTVGNAKSEVVKDLFIKLINHLKKQVTVPDNYICNELVALSAYTTDRNPRIYGFSTANNTISFRFHPTPTNDTDVSIQNWTSTVTNPVTVNAINVSNYFDSNTAFSLNNYITLSNGSTIPLASIKHINFCPTELCKKHIAFVLDESGSISIEEARKIRKQLKNFVIAQADANVATQTNTYVSLIGMSDSDSGATVRTDHIIGYSRIDTTNLQTYLNWIEAYRTQRPLTPVITGLSRSSDFWNSGLQKALDIKADYVVLITDGCESANVPLLKQTLSQFDNYQNPNRIKAGPHLYVIGIENGFYIDESTVANKTAVPTELVTDKNNANTEDAILSREMSSTDPNINPNLAQSSVANRTEGYLTKSLKYLLNYAITSTPPFINLDKYDFLTADYFACNDFDFLSTEKDYIYNNLQKISITCGAEIPQKVCDNCSGYKPMPGKDYLLSAWVKEERNEQVITYTLPKIKLIFNKFNADGSVGTATGSPVVFATSNSDIIEGWQRIFGKFSIPLGTDMLSIELVNESTSIPVFFDDVRIHPVDGSMKSFVYDPETFKLMSELDENNYATFYEYDKEGGLVRVKKETAKGIKTIQETRSGSVIKQ